jgi:hypothetical protein
MHNMLEPAAHLARLINLFLTNNKEEHVLNTIANLKFLDFNGNSMYKSI